MLKQNTQIPTTADTAARSLIHAVPDLQALGSDGPAIGKLFKKKTEKLVFACKS